MSKVDADHATGLLIDHEVREMPVANAQDVLRHANQRVAHRKVALERVEGLRRGAHL